MTYAIGDKVWFRGDEVTITTEPYCMFGAMWQDGITTECGKLVSVKTPGQRAADAARKQAEWREQQDAFKRLRA